MNSPASTYRIQFNKDFTFAHLEEIIPYLTDLGVQTIYASPIFQAVPGSNHGYDVLNPLLINPEIGTEEQLVTLTTRLAEQGIGWLQDIVPNHMAFDPGNPWLMDVLERWEQSPYFRFFDIGFTDQSSGQRLMVPFLSCPLTEAITNGEVKLTFERGKFSLNRWPVNERSLKLIIRDSKLSGAGDADEVRQRLKEVNQDPRWLEQIADAQFYRLCHWRETETTINYRRFFTVNGLICLNMQYDEVFESYHRYIFSLVKKGVFQGLRIDHIDGLFDPTGYLERLRAAVGNEVYLVVEKILGNGEKLAPDWKVQGSTGYDFLAMVNNVFTNKKAKKPFSRLYGEVTHKPLKVAEQILVKKSEILFKHMKGELAHLVSLFIQLKLAGLQKPSDKLRASLRMAIGQLLIHCPVYRFYSNHVPLSAGEQLELEKVFARIERNEEVLAGLEMLKTALLGSGNGSSVSRKNAAHFFMRCMQFSGPLMAKGVEDTLMYTYNRFIANNEVGDGPEHFGISTDQFHHQMMDRQKSLPLSLNGTATHDTKRGEDVRARLNVLTDVPGRWRKLVKLLQQGQAENLKLHQNDAYMIYQALFGAIPLDSSDTDDFDQRMGDFIEKALREAKKRSDWAAPNLPYEHAAKRFASKLLNPGEDNQHKLQAFLSEIADYSIINSLVQLLLKCSCPGIPDIYQGSELWELSLVDPDNRRPVDYQLRSNWLTELKGKAEVSRLWEQRATGKVKLWLTQLLLKLRRDNKELFESGEYIPLAVTGKYRNNVLAFLRRLGDKWLLVTVPLGLASIVSWEVGEISSHDWQDTTVILPTSVPLQWKNLLSGAMGQRDVLNKGILVSELFSELPISLMWLKPGEDSRGSGVLLHISSLPSAFGIGDMGPQAMHFVDFLSQAKQKYWQVLPLNPTSATQFYSPYSSSSAMAGNLMLISPELLRDLDLLSEDDIIKNQLPVTETVDFEGASAVKKRLLEIAYRSFCHKEPTELVEEYVRFCDTEKKWLQDYALFIALGNHYDCIPWNQWPEPYKLRDVSALANFSSQYEDKIDELKWQQFIFQLQWHGLKDYANRRGVSLIGDLPFYVAHDSADVWANKECFKLNEDMSMAGIAGVPPDAFSDCGQLWGMPVFDWQLLEREGYRWWMDRIARNLELFDSLRLDHFRAFDSFWQVPGGETTAVNGSWQDGPGSAFFKAVCNRFNELPFIVEDLGGDMRGTAELRDEFAFPGMKVLQFGFGSDLPFSPHLPHNYGTGNFVAYTGTHDNNTCRGWYELELDGGGKKRLELYAGHRVSSQNVNRVMIRIALSSPAKVVIMQLQDLLGLDGSARMNTPATTEKNWAWRARLGGVTEQITEWLLHQTEAFGRG